MSFTTINKLIQLFNKKVWLRNGTVNFLQLDKQTQGCFSNYIYEINGEK